MISFNKPRLLWSFCLLLRHHNLKYKLLFQTIFDKKILRKNYHNSNSTYEFHWRCHSQNPYQTKLKEKNNNLYIQIDQNLKKK